jgi:hypothetical protein
LSSGPNRAVAGLLIGLAAAAGLVSGCGGSAVSGASVGTVLETKVVRVNGPASSASSASCFLRLTSQIEGGGTMTYCLEKFTGEPGPNDAVKSSGTLTLAFPEGEIHSSVRVVQTFEADGKHADQELTGNLTGGTGDYAGVKGTIAGGGANLESPPGTISESNLRYVIDFGG